MTSMVERGRAHGSRSGGMRKIHDKHGRKGTITSRRVKDAFGYLLANLSTADGHCGKLGSVQC